MPLLSAVSLVFLLVIVNTRAFLFVFLSLLMLPLALTGVCGIRTLTLENPVMSDSCVPGQDPGIPGSWTRYLQQCAAPAVPPGAE